MILTLISKSMVYAMSIHFAQKIAKFCRGESFQYARKGYLVYRSLLFSSKRLRNVRISNSVEAEASRSIISHTPRNRVSSVSLRLRG